jgi:hypothetical protein
MKYDFSNVDAEIESDGEQRGPCPCPNVDIITHGDDSGSCVGNCPEEINPKVLVEI